MAKILIVEDDQFLSKMYTKKFQVSGFEVELAHDGQEALTKVSSFMPDIILMDILMPKMNGLEALDKLKADPKTKHIPVIMSTNLSTSDDADTAMKKGAVKYIVKSEVTPTQIVQIVSGILKH